MDIAIHEIKSVGQCAVVEVVGEVGVPGDMKVFSGRLSFGGSGAAGSKLGQLEIHRIGFDGRMDDRAVVERNFAFEFRSRIDAGDVFDRAVAEDMFVAAHLDVAIRMNLARYAVVVASPINDFAAHRKIGFVGENGIGLWWSQNPNIETLVVAQGW